MPYGTPLHWACASRNFAAISILLAHGAYIDAKCFNSHPHSTPLALAVHFGDVETVSFLLRNGADPQIKDTKDRTLLHRLSYNLPELHAMIPRSWHYWIRHGNWEEHKSAVSEMVQLLLDAGNKLESYSTSYPPLTPLLAAAELGFADGGIILALLKAGADANGPKATCKDSALILWSSVAGEKLPYPNGYREVMKAVLTHTQDLEYSNDQGQTALHIIASINNSSQRQFHSNVSAFLAMSLPQSLDALDRNRNTPMLLALTTEDDPISRVELLLDHGANMHTVNAWGENIIAILASNKALMDEESAEFIKVLLGRLHGSAEEEFQKFGESNKTALWNACTFSRPKTLKLLLDLGMSRYINDMKITRGEADKTALDIALDYGEASRQSYMMQFAKYGKNPDPKLIGDSSYQLYDDKQGGPKRACELAEIARL
jgi:ankyrin repeat protein